MSHKVLHRRWHRRLVALERNVRTLFEQCRITGGAETIHDLRVAIRRARLYAQVGRPLLRRAGVKQFDAWARTVNDFLGPVRDCDVCMNWLAGCPDALDAIRLICDERVRLWNRAATVLRRKKTDLGGGMVLRTKEKNPAQKLGQRWGRELANIRTEVFLEAARAERRDAEQWHDLRRRLRRWRYLRELGLPKRTHSTDEALSWLIKVQDALGEFQNLEMVRRILGEHAEWPEGRRFIERAQADQAKWITRASRDLRKMPPEMD